MKLTKFNPFDFITQEDEVLDFLNECANDNDPQLFVLALKHLIEKKGISEVCTLTGLSSDGLHKEVFGDTQPTWDKVHKVMHALNISISFQQLKPEY